MKNNKGQALVEFIIILPIVLLLIISIIDFGNIFYKKYALENDIDTIIDMYKSGDFTEINSYVSDKDIEIKYSDEDKFITVELTKNVNITSPILTIIFGKKYEIKIDRSIYKNE